VAFGMPRECVIHVEDNETAITCLQGLLHDGDIVLIKGSRGMMMEQIVEALSCAPTRGDPSSRNTSDPRGASLGDSSRSVCCPLCQAMS
jgi:hypothetical protein